MLSSLCTKETRCSSALLCAVLGCSQNLRARSPIADILDVTRQRWSAKRPHLFAQRHGDRLTALQLLDKVPRRLQRQAQFEAHTAAVDDPEKVRSDSQVTENGKLERRTVGQWASNASSHHRRPRCKKGSICAVSQPSEPLELLQLHPCRSHVTL